MTDNEGLYTETQLSRYLQVSVAALRRWRFEKRGPRFLKVGSLVRYQASDVQAWLQSCPAGGSSATSGANTSQTNACQNY